MRWVADERERRKEKRESHEIKTIVIENIVHVSFGHIIPIFSNFSQML